MWKSSEQTEADADPWAQLLSTDPRGESPFINRKPEEDLKELNAYKKPLT